MVTPIDSGVIPLDTELHWLIQADAAPADPLAPPPGLLTEEERATWAAFKVEKRRREWLLGRETAKKVLAGLVEARIGHRPALDEIAVIAHADGWPVAHLPSLDGRAFAATLSISHAGGRAFCAALEGEQPLLGADLEQIAPRVPGFVEAYFTDLEQRFLAAAPVEQRGELINAIWSGKEAALKAIRRGLAEDTRLVSCLPHPPMIAPTGWLPMRIAWEAERMGTPLPPLVGRWRPYDGFVVTLATGVMSVEFGVTS
jgi:4'-phosphopantetheinyl transferase